VIRGGSGALDSVGFVMTMCLIGLIGFYLGIDIPQARTRGMQIGRSRFGKEVNPVELLSACGTFLNAIAALVSVTVIIHAERLQLNETALVGCMIVRHAM
jgi:hypothetical protein